MASLELTDALDGLKIADLEDLARYKRAIADGEQIGFGYYFPFLLTHNRPGSRAALLVVDEDSVCVFRWTAEDAKPRLDVLMAPSPMNVNVLRRCLERANDFNGDKSARVLKIDAKDAERVAALPGLRVEERKSQYLYAPESFGDISGGKYRTVRRNVAKVQAMDALEVLPYAAAHKALCLALLRRWRRHHREAHGTMGGIGTTRRMIELAGAFDEPDVRGEVVLIGGKLVGFAFGGEIRPGYAAFLEAKCDIDIPGLSYFQRYSFMSKLERFELVNDGSGLDREGLVQLKNSLRPVGMHTEYRGTQRQA